ncbi:MAG: tRNA preQ1(34) S-adenosylmethionine ribosyltransferase-isomerase QueA [Pseudomonadota bacterium]
MQLSEFDFHLPEDRIALRPVEPRSAARLLLAGPEDHEDRIVADLPAILRPGDVLVVNDTRVLPARLDGERRRETADGSGVARIEATLALPDGPGGWHALVRPARRLKAGDVIDFRGGLRARVATDPAAGIARLAFDRAGPALEAALAEAGAMPLPPYIASRRAADERDRHDYQTIFAAGTGSVAAPTASLHFDAALLAALDAAGIERETLTLHVGPGTFLPVKTDAVADHVMHAERAWLSAETAARLNAARAEGRRLIAVGTTALRLLETAADADRRFHPFDGETAIFIRPGHVFRGIDGLMTNFHLPKSTLFMLVAALMGLARMQALYAHAIGAGYRFYSYGDSSLLLPMGR